MFIYIFNIYCTNYSPYNIIIAMKHKTLKVLIIIPCITLIMKSCVVEQIAFENNQGSLHPPTDQSIKALNDTEITAAQTDLYALLAKQVQCKDSIFLLAISKEEANILNIPDSIYDKFENVIKLMNSTKR